MNSENESLWYIMHVMFADLINKIKGFDNIRHHVTVCTSQSVRD